jgi:class 3 adenylate cyclase
MQMRTVARVVAANLALVAALLGACSTTWDIDRYEAPEATFATRHTYAWKTGQFSTPVARPGAEVAAIDRAVREAVEEELARKGYELAPDPATADMIVSFQISGYRRFVLSDDKRIGAPSATQVLTPSGTAQLPPTAVVPREQTVGDGSMIVFVDDPKSNRLIWRGLITAQTRVRSPEAGVRLAADMARAIAREIPSP